MHVWSFASTEFCCLQRSKSQFRVHKEAISGRKTSMPLNSAWTTCWAMLPVLMMQNPQDRSDKRLTAFLLSIMISLTPLTQWTILIPLLKDLCSVRKRLMCDYSLKYKSVSYANLLYDFVWTTFKILLWCICILFEAWKLCLLLLVNWQIPPCVFYWRTKSYRFGTTQVWINDDRILIFWMNDSFKICSSFILNNVFVLILASFEITCCFDAAFQMNT